MKTIILIIALLFSCFSQVYCPVHSNHYHKHIHKVEDASEVIPQLSFDNKINDYKEDNSYYLSVSSKSLENISSLSFDIVYEKDVIKINNIYNNLPIDSSSMYDSKIDNENGVVHISYIFSENTKFEDANFLSLRFKTLIVEKENSFFSIAVTSATDQYANSIEVNGDFYYFFISKSTQTIGKIYISGQIDKRYAKRNELISITYSSFSLKHIGAGSFEFLYDKDGFEFFACEKRDFLNSSSMHSIIKTDIPGCVRVSFADSNIENTYNYNLFTIQLKVKANIDKSWEFKLNSSGLSSKDGNKKYLSDTIINNITTVFEEDVSLLPLLYLISKTDESNKKLDVTLSLEEDSHLAAADIEIHFDTMYLSYNSYESLVKLSDNPMLGVNTNDVKTGLLKISRVYLSDLTSKVDFVKLSFDILDVFNEIKTPVSLKVSGTRDLNLKEIKLACQGIEIPLSINKHDWSNWEVVNETTCIKDGLEKRVCSYCNKIETRTINSDPTLHAYGEWIVDINPTCTENGSKHKTCEHCGDVITEIIPSLGGHKLGTWEISKEASCTELGLKVQKCTKCGEIVNTETIPATGHTYGDWIIDKEVTCTKSGSKHKTCGTCGDVVTEIIAPHGHDLIHHDKVDPTCTTSGHEAYDTCSKCDYSTYKEIAALGHDYVTKVVEPTCTKDGYKEEVCSHCGDTRNRTILPATGHTYGDWIIDKDATCTKSGSKHKTCGTCGDVVTEIIAPHGHDLIHHDKVDPTCTTSGHEAYDTCSKCDYSTYKEIPALGHDYGEWKVEVEPTTESEGLKTRTCSICGEKETEVIPKLEKEINLNPIIIGGTCALGGLIVIVLIIVMFKNRRR